METRDLVYKALIASFLKQLDGARAPTDGENKVSDTLAESLSQAVSSLKTVKNIVDEHAGFIKNHPVKNDVLRDIAKIRKLCDEIEQAIGHGGGARTENHKS